MASADFLQFVVTAASEPNLPPSARPPLVLTHSFSPCNCLIYWQRFRTAIGREIVWHPCPRCLPYEIPVRQFRDLPAPSFRFHLAVDTLGVRLYPSRCRADSGLSPVGTCARRAHKKSGGSPSCERRPSAKREAGGALLSRAPGRSIIAAGALNGRVRDGNGCDSPAKATSQKSFGIPGPHRKTMLRAAACAASLFRSMERSVRRMERRRASPTAYQNASGERVAALAPCTCQPGSLPGAFRGLRLGWRSSGGLGA